MLVFTALLLLLNGYILIDFLIVHLVPPTTYLMRGRNQDLSLRSCGDPADSGTQTLRKSPYFFIFAASRHVTPKAVH